MAYNAIDLGPVPQRWDQFYSAFDGIVVQARLVHEQECITLTGTADADRGCFTDSERTVINTVRTEMKSLVDERAMEEKHCNL